MGKLLYKPLSLVFGVTGGLLAGALFKQVWRVVAGDEEVPEPTDEKRRLDEVLFAAALRGAVVALVRAAVARGGARGVRALTGSWPA
jgi:hypothetical protein